MDCICSLDKQKNKVGDLGMKKDVRRKLIEICLGILFYIYAIWSTRHGSFGIYQQFFIFLIPYLIVVIDLMLDLISNFKQHKFFDSNLLILLATLGAFLVGKNTEAVGVLLIFEIGRLFETLALYRSKKSIEKFMDIRPDFANRKIRDEEVVVDPRELELHNTIIIRPGERIPVDATVTLGTSSVDTMALTGESVPREVKVGNKLYSGSINLTGVLEARVTKLYGESTASKILDLVQNANTRKAESENFARKFNRWYTPLVTILAFVVMILPPMTFARGDLHTWVYRGLVFLVTACPCGMMISVPLAFFGGIGAASRQGVLIKGSNFLEALAKTETFIFDKTGTLTEGVFSVKEYHPIGMTSDEMLDIIVHGEAHSNHPIAVSLRESYAKEIDKNRVKWVKEFSGFGVQADVDGKEVFIGNARFMKEKIFVYDRVRAAGTTVHLAVDGKYAGYILLTDTIRPDAKKTIRRLKKYQAVVVMLTGDNEKTAKTVANELGIDTVIANLMPEDKVEQVQEYMDSQLDEEKLAFVGDGLNDAPVLAMADIGIAMGGLGSDAAIEAADIVLMEDEPSKIINAVRISRETLRVVRQNMIYAITIKMILLVFATIGYISMRGAIAVDMIVLAINLLNSFWVIRYPE